MTAPRRPPPLRRGDFYYIPRDGAQPQRMVSVTTVLNESAKPALVTWAAKTAAETALANPDWSVEKASGSIYSVNEAAKLRGSTIHSWIEAYSKGAPLELEGLPEALQGYARAFLKFRSSVRLRPVYAELTVFNETWGYAGTLDELARTEDDDARLGSNAEGLAAGLRAGGDLDGLARDTVQEGRLRRGRDEGRPGDRQRTRGLVLIDYKTGKGVYDEHEFQLSAYRRATSAMDPRTRDIYTMPPIDSAMVVQLKPDGTFVLHDMPDRWPEFLAYLHLWRSRRKMECPEVCWCHEHKPTLAELLERSVERVKAKAMVPPDEYAAQYHQRMALEATERTTPDLMGALRAAAAVANPERFERAAKQAWLDRPDGAGEDYPEDPDHHAEEDRSTVERTDKERERLMDEEAAWERRVQ